MKNVYSLGIENLDIFKRFLLENGFAHTDDNGNIKTNSITLDELFDILKKFSDFLAKNKKQDTNMLPVVTATAKKAKSVMLEVTKTGSIMRDKDSLPQIYSKEEIWFATGDKGSKKNPKPIDTAITLNFEELEEWKGILPKNNRVSPFVLEILTHCATLIEAGNEYITTKMLFRQLNGGKDKTPTKNFYDAFYKALSILACTRIKINASEEFQAGYNERKYYEGALLPNTIQGKEIITMNGSFIEDSIHFLGQSPLFEYAKAKGQISSIAPEMYDIPINRTEENIVLIGYLIRAYASMTNQYSKVRPIIRYDTLYSVLGVEGSNTKQTYKNKAKIRKTVKEILTAWIEGKFIKGFQELTEDNKPAKKGATVAKILLTLYTVKEFKTVHNDVNILPPK